MVFTEVTEAAGLGAFRHATGATGEKWFPETMGGGGGFVDYDGDGRLDLVLVGGGVWAGAEPPPALRLYWNRGDGTFEDHTADAALADLHAYAFGVTAADYDGDGDADLFVTTLGRNLLLRNEAGRFADVTEAAGLADAREWSSAAVFLDADADGDLDLYVGNYVDWAPERDRFCTVAGGQKSYCTPELYEGLPGRFYRNRGDGTFEERTAEAGFGGTPGKTLAATADDLDRDGDPDLVAGNDTQRDLLFRNRGDGTFEEVGLRAGIALDENGKARAGMGVDTGVVDATGAPTVFVGNFAKEMIGVYRRGAGGFYEERAAVSRIGRPSLPTLTFGLFLFDADLDGDLDLFAANGHITPEVDGLEAHITYRQRPQLFLNDGAGTFAEMLPGEGPLAQPLVARGAAYGDYDADGDLDVLVTENGGPAHLWRNDTAGGTALVVHLAGRPPNRDALGARVALWAGGLMQERTVRTGSSYLSQSQRTPVFGLGGARPDSLTVYWPGGGVSRFGGLPADGAVWIDQETERLRRTLQNPEAP
ncbi:MAG: CRTAC1 family protein [Rhodothermales bacterium]|nr:CRTAC1 family protein [Rhodothermales bacterium]